ncbi:MULTISPECIES: DUF6891 domain-containing protein [Streptomyces]|jgi:hypothetical protein|uniref:DUF6891 domain-containing protein n=1 Tax=Streptomyces nymphaeiformis TaxID=2663842 RepID=A0A7W7X9H3_9ACTN|nr:hypothetical protein [Streptomyces nymphaeiformis]MBB4979877.1 hypothetical protein [Streptomyces nymphaeiformis]
MLDIAVETENQEKHVRPSEEDLTGLVRRIGADGDHFLVLQRIPDLPSVFAQVWHDAGGDYQVEHRAGAPELHFGTRLDDPERVAGVLAAWARGEAGWDAGPTWQNMGFPAAPAVPELPGEVREEIEGRVRSLLVCGYDDRARLTRIAQEEVFSPDEHPVSREQAEALVDRLWLERVEEMAGWEGTTDPERLTAAFAGLDAAGIVAREHFTCCRSCGTAEIGAEEGADRARGFVFFHTQCTEGAADGGPLYLLYGRFDHSPETTAGTTAETAAGTTAAAIGEEVAAALRGRGLSVEWDGDPGQAIQVTGLDWRRRLTG